MSEKVKIIYIIYSCRFKDTRARISKAFHFHIIFYT